MGSAEQTEMQHMLERIEYLEKENRYLKDLLDRAGISYEKTSDSNQAQEETFDPNQGARIQHVEITDELANRFFSRFWGRQDVYSKRYVKKSTGEVGVLSVLWVSSYSQDLLQAAKLGSIKAAKYRVPVAAEAFFAGRSEKVMFCGGKIRDFSGESMTEAEYGG